MKIRYDIERTITHRAHVSVEAPSEDVAQEVIKTAFEQDWPQSVKIRVHTNEGTFEPKSSDELHEIFARHAPECTLHALPHGVED